MPKSLAGKILKQRVSKNVGHGGTIDRVHNLQEEYRPGQNVQDSKWTGGHPIGGDRNQNYNRQVPIRAGHPDPHDKMYDIKQQYVAGTLKGPDGEELPKQGLGMAIFDESDKQYLANKEKQAEEIEYESFASSIFNLDDPATAALVSEKILPDFYAKREAEIDKMAKLQSRLAKIRMRGGWPRDNDEMALMFALKKGYLQLPRGAIWDFPSWKKLDNYQRGIFNPMRYILGNKEFDSVDSVFAQSGANINFPGPVAGRAGEAGPRY